jgi:hypothetical protein
MSDDIFDLDVDLDDVGDLVQFVNPHNGTSVYGIVFAGMDKIGNEKKGVKVIYQLVQTLEKADPDGEEAPVGSVWQESFTSNDMGKKLLKLRLKQFFGDDIKGSMRPYIEAMHEKGKSEFMVKMTTKLTQSKGKDANGNERDYENVRVISAEAISPITVPEGFEWMEYKPSDD